MCSLAPSGIADLFPLGHTFFFSLPLALLPGMRGAILITGQQSAMPATGFTVAF
jgi:hypothetical protein